MIIRWYSARLRRIIVLLFNKMSKKCISQLGNVWLCSAWRYFWQILATYVYCRISVTHGWQMLKASRPYLKSVTICLIITNDILCPGNSKIYEKDLPHLSTANIFRQSLDPLLYRDFPVYTIFIVWSICCTRLCSKKTYKELKGSKLWDPGSLA